MADNFMMKIPYFAKGKADSLERALTTGRFKDGLDKALYFFAIDTKQWVLVDTDKNIHIITGANSPTPGPGGEGGVKRVDVLPPILEGDVETLYILGDIIYSFNGLAYVPTYQEIIGNLPSDVTVVEYVDSVRDEIVEETKDYVDNLVDITVIP